MKFFHVLCFTLFHFSYYDGIKWNDISSVVRDLIQLVEYLFYLCMECKFVVDNCCRPQLFESTVASAAFATDQTQTQSHGPHRDGDRRSEIRGQTYKQKTPKNNKIKRDAFIQYFQNRSRHCCERRDYICVRCAHAFAIYFADAGCQMVILHLVFTFYVLIYVWLHRKIYDDDDALKINSTNDLHTPCTKCILAATDAAAVGDSFLSHYVFLVRIADDWKRFIKFWLRLFRSARNFIACANQMAHARFRTECQM